MLAVTLATVLLLPQQPVKINAMLTNDRPVVGERTMLRITVETRDIDPQRIEMPSLPAGFDLVGTEDVSEARSAFPGGRNRITEKRWLIVGRVPGQFSIPGVRVIVNGRTYVTSPLSIMVLGGEGRRSGGPDDALLDAVVQPDTVYVGEQIILEVTASLTRGLRARQTRPATYQAPSPTGFWIHDVPEPLSVGMRTIDGTLYETQTFRRAYFPLTHGSYRLPPARLSYEVRRGFLSSPESFELLSDSPSVEVLPVPENGRPANFRGAVGSYSVRASLTPTSIGVGDAARLIVEIEGTGNVKALPAPLLPALEGFEIHPPTEDATVETDDAVMGGQKTFAWVLVAEMPGRLELPPIEYAYFDPAIDSFATARTESLALDVSGTATPPPNAGLAPIAHNPTWLTPALLRSPAFLAAQLVPLLAILFAGLARTSGTRRTRRRNTATERRDHFAPMRAPVAAPTAAFWADLDAAIRATVADAMHDSGLATATTAEIADALTRADVATATVAAITDSLATVERVRFGAGSLSDAARATLIDRVEQATRAIAKWRRAGTVTVMIATAFVLVAPLAAPAHAQQAGSDGFEQGVVAYQNGAYEDALGAFEAHVRAHPYDANAWYDLGNVYWTNGDRGRAVHAWLRAVRLAPQHSAARANLDLTVGGAAHSFTPPRAAFAPTQALLALVALWWLAGAALAWLIARRRPLRNTVLTVGAAALLIGAAAWLGVRGTDGAVVFEDTTLLTAPVLKAEPIQRLPAGTLVQLIEQREQWVRVRIGPLEGWTERTPLGEL